MTVSWNNDARDFWRRAERALLTAHALVDDDPDGSASRAYYAAFYSVSALFAVAGRSFAKHKPVEAAVHRDLVMTGRWPKELGAAYAWLADIRTTGDYGGETHVALDEARRAVEKAAAIADEVRRALPDRPSEQ